MSILGWSCLQTALVRIRARIPDVLLAICLRKKEPQADTACRFGVSGIKTLGSRNRNAQIDNILEWSRRILRIDGRRFHDIEELPVLINQRLNVGVKVLGRNSEFVGSSDLDGRESVRSL